MMLIEKIRRQTDTFFIHTSTKTNAKHDNTIMIIITLSILHLFQKTVTNRLPEGKLALS